MLEVTSDTHKSMLFQEDLKTRSAKFVKGKYSNIKGINTKRV